MKQKTLLFILFLLSTLMASAYDAKVNGVYYNFVTSAKTATVTYYSTSSNSSAYTGNVTIPATVTYNGVNYSVTEIGKSAFSGCKYLKSVIIPNSVTSIKHYAFSECSELTSVTIPNGVIYIESYAFNNCSGLTSVTIGNSVTTIGDHAFWNCSSLTSIKIPNSVTSIGMYAFYGCKGLTSVTIPNSVTSIEDYAFSGCSGLTSIIVESGNKNYDSRNNCNAIIKTASNTLIAGCKNTVIPNGVTSIGQNAFYYCSDITYIEIPNSVTSIGQNAFYFCSGLTSIEIPNSVSLIKQGAFWNCQGLTSVTIGNSVTEIGYNAFNGCLALTDVFCYAEKIPTINKDAYNNTPIGNATLHVLPASVQDYQAASPWSTFGTIEAIFPINGIFYRLNTQKGEAEVTTGGIKYIGKVSIPENVAYDNVTYSVTSIGNKAFECCTGLTNVRIPNSVTSLGEKSFFGCSNLTSVTIGKGVTSIGDYAFSGCPELIDVYCRTRKGATTGRDVFLDSDIQYATLYVPGVSVNGYKTTTPWSEFGNVVPIESMEPNDKCETPTIDFTDGKMSFSCETEDVEYVCNFEFETDGTDISLPATVKISVYATKDGYEPSDVLTQVIDPRIIIGKLGDVNGDGEVGMPDVMYIIQYILNGKYPGQ